jgi:hypothetical protein
LRLRIVRIALLLCLASDMAWGSAPVRGAEGEQADRSLVEHSGEIFFGTIDIVTAIFPVQSDVGPAMNTEYTVLVSDVLKGNLRPQTMVVVRQDGGDADFVDGDGPLTPGAEYLFFARYDPALLRYVIVEPAIGNVLITSPEQRDELSTYWSDVVQQTTCLYTDVLTVDGVVYARRDWNEDKRYLDREQVGPTIATVAVQDTSATGCRTDLADGTASNVPAGTKIQSVDGYAPTFRVAVRMPDRHRYLYEAIWNENAKIGADLLDISGRVRRIVFKQWSDCKDIGYCDHDLWSTIDYKRITRVVETLMESPVRPQSSDWRRPPPSWMELTFALTDGSTVNMVIDLDTGYSQSGIRIPVEQVTTILGTS